MQTTDRKDSGRFAPELYLEAKHVPKGIGKWRKLYLEFLRASPLAEMASLVELGSGSPDFLLAAPQKRKVAVDISDKYAQNFRDHGIEFYKKNLDQDSLEDIGRADVVICSDVFEHLLNPIFALAAIAEMVGDDGVLVSHVPNEFTTRKTLSVMLGRSTGTNFHNADEWDDPHFRRFTKIGFEKFLRLRFACNIPIQQLRYAKPARLVRSLRLPVPYCLEGGPTFISTNNRELAAALSRAAETFRR